MRRFCSLRRRSDFARLRRRGRRIGTPCLTIFHTEVRQAERWPLVGISIGKAVGGAVARNKLRRQLQAILQTVLDGQAQQILIVARPNAASVSYWELCGQVRRSLV